MSTARALASAFYEVLNFITYHRSMTKNLSWSEVIGEEGHSSIWSQNDLDIAFGRPFPSVTEANYEYGIALCDMVEEAMAKGVSRKGLVKSMSLWNGVNKLEAARLFFHVCHMDETHYISRYKPSHDAVELCWPAKWPLKWRFEKEDLEAGVSQKKDLMNDTFNRINSPPKAKR